ncbi:ribosomal protein S5 domain 2-like protein [Mytilinidion resinicola]|uniref:Ribosomal RNA-processing protein 41 n=1 Tax=Mytilinidion resinicola TaxID=574789 RepID=A0A6A6YHV4_9PEZI|nr:ribosomal protein S5 domain 2-like protein [Mytilinidion resinicola]KAF2808416.1 ribosomal protein S5 domain 2-like protein [Mytilinidion resinicola]
MPLDTSTYALALLRLDGRRWNELRRIRAQTSTQAAADGSSYLEMGNTQVICTVIGPAEGRNTGAGRSGGREGEANLEVEIGFAGFSGVDRKRRGKGDKRTAEMAHTLSTAFSSLILMHLYPHSTISIHINILSQDGSILAACINAATLALVDAGVPMTDYLVACTAASSPTTSASAGGDEVSDPLLDLNAMEEQELPFLTLATVGGGEKITVLVMETRVRVERIEGMLAVGIEGCKRVKNILDGVVRGVGR